MKTDDYSKFAEKFVDDANNLLNELEINLLELEKNYTKQDIIEAVFRVMHTLKGIGSMFGFNYISEYTHHLENIYDKIREGLLKINPEIFEVTFASVDHLRNLLGDQYLNDKELKENHSKLTEKIKTFLTTEPDDRSSFKIRKDESEKPSGIITWYIQFICSEDLIKRAINIVFIFQDLAKLGTYQIYKHEPTIFENTDNSTEVWGILLDTKASLSEIEEVFMFVSDNVIIVKFANQNPGGEYNIKSKEQTISIFDLAQSLGSEVYKEENSDALRLGNSDKTQNKNTHISQRISVGADKLDKLMYLVSELFTTRSELVSASRNSDLTRIKIAVEKIEKLSNQFRNNALSIRLVPLKEITIKFKRLIRDLSLQLNKSVDFQIHGDETELDKNLVDHLADPLMHIIRNCLDHGIETVDNRRKNNKPDTGIISFFAYQSGNYIYIQISDDGNGIDKDFILKKAIEKGFIQSNANLTDKEVLDLIFLPGFSTAESLSQVSGRGVGMDVVKRSIADLRGSVEIVSEKGKGTTFTIKLQQTISIMDTLMIRAGNMYFTLLLEDVEICGLETHSALFDRENNHLVISGELIPFISLRSAFSIKGEAPETERVVVVKRQNSKYAIVADSIIGQYQAVIKPLSAIIKHKDYLSGASIMGDGNIAFMIDTQKLSLHKSLQKNFQLSE